MVSDQGDNPDHWAEFSERGTLLGLRTMLFIYDYSGRWLFRPVAFIAVSYFVLVSSKARRASAEFLNQVWVFAEGRSALSRRPTFLTTVRHFHAFAEAILDKLAAWKGDIDIDEIDHVNRHTFEERYRQGKGGVWITSHLGNIEVCRAISQQQLDFRMTVLVHTKHAKNFNRLLKEVAPDSNVDLLEVTDFTVASAMLLQQRIKHGEFVVIVGDRAPVGKSARTVACDFLGRRALFPLGPFILAMILDCPVGTMFCVREGKRYKIVIDDLPGLEGVKRSERDEATARAAQQYATRLESLCIQHPLQWFNFFPFWDKSVNSGESGGPEIACR
jgi:predicted LPLAT superfamily acyltransferase